MSYVCQGSKCKHPKRPNGERPIRVTVSTRKVGYLAHKGRGDRTEWETKRFPAPDSERPAPMVDYIGTEIVQEQSLCADCYSARVAEQVDKAFA